MLVGLCLTLLDATVASSVGQGLSLRGGTTVLRAHVIVTLVVALALELLLGGARLVEQRLGARLRRPRLAATLLGAGVALPGGVWLATDLAAGAWIAAQSWVVWFRVATALVLALGGGAIALWSRYRERRWALGAGVTFALACALLDRLMLVGLYGAAHLVLHIATVVPAYLVTTGLLRRLRASKRLLSAGPALFIVTLSAAGAGTPLLEQARDLRATPTVRALLTSFLPTGSDQLVLRLIASQVESPRAHPGSSTAIRRPKIRNVILLVVDTLRADALPPVRSGSGRFSGKDTPFIDSWLKTSTRFRAAYASANRTRLSLPSTFESREPFDVTTEVTKALALRAREAGLTSTAVIPNWFFRAEGQEITVLDGYDDVRSYSPEESDAFVHRASGALDSVHGKRFFLWAHYFGMHHPYVAAAPHAPTSSLTERYAAALRELDAQLAKLVGELRERDLERNTLIVLMSDHGELLGELGRSSHGTTLLDAEIHVPLAFWLPKVEPRVIDDLVGNLDVVPTIFDLLDRPTAEFAGRSLAPLLLNGTDLEPEAYYQVSGDKKYVGTVTRDHALIYTRDVRSIEVYERGDLLRSYNLFGLEPRADRAVLTFFSKNPELFSRELGRPEVRAALVARLDSFALREDSRAVETLLRLAAKNKDQELRSAVDRAFDRAATPALKRRIFERMVAQDRGYWGARASAELRRSTGEEETAWLEKMTRASVPLLDVGHALARLSALSSCVSPEARAWYEYLAKIPLPRELAPTLEQALICVTESDARPPRELSIALYEALGKLPERSITPHTRRLLLKSLRRGHPDLAISAADALGTQAEEAALEALRAEAQRSRDHRVAAASIVAVARIEGPASTPFLVELGKNGGQPIGVFTALREVGDERALPYLQRAMKHNTGSRAYAAKQAIRAIKQRAAAKATGRH